METLTKFKHILNEDLVVGSINFPFLRLFVDVANTLFHKMKKLVRERDTFPIPIVIKDREMVVVKHLNPILKGAIPHDNVTNHISWIKELFSRKSTTQAYRAFIGT